MENINIPRCYKPRDSDQIVEYTLHLSDASESGYGDASYLRMVNENGDVHYCLIFRKSIAEQVKYVSIPILEMTAATLSFKVSDMFRKNLDIPFALEEFWAESQALLAYVNAEAWSFKTFVVNCEIKKVLSQ